MSTTTNGNGLQDPFQGEREALLRRIDGGIAWYETHARDRGKRARRLRLAALSFAFMAGLLPLLRELDWQAFCLGLGAWMNVHGQEKLCRGSSFSPIWSSVCLLLAGFMLGLEKYHGHAPAWMRFIEAKASLETLRTQLAIDLRHAGVSAMPGANPPPDERALLTQANKDLDQIVRSELSQWFAEFGAAMKDTPSGVKT